MAEPRSSYDSEFLPLRASLSKTPINFPTFSVDNDSNDGYELILIFGSSFSLIIHSHRIVASVVISVWPF